MPWGTYFFTVCLTDKQASLLVDEVDLLRHAVSLCQKQRPFTIDAAAVLPAMAHMKWTLPPDDTNFSARWRQIKATFSRHVDPPLYQSKSAQRRGEKGIWQRRFWEYRIRAQADYDLHAHLIATAPLRAGLERGGQDWPLCSAYRLRMRFNASPKPAKTIALAP